MQETLHALSFVSRLQDTCRTPAIFQEMCRFYGLHCSSTVAGNLNIFPVCHNFIIKRLIMALLVTPELS